MIGAPRPLACNMHFFHGPTGSSTNTSCAMENSLPNNTLSPNRRLGGLDRLFDAARKDTVIRLRWPLVILSSYLLYYDTSEWFTEAQVQAVLILYLLSHSTLYFLSDELFDSPFFYGPLLLFDTVVLAVVLSTSGTASPDFYVACVLTVILSCICNDARGLLAVTLLAPLVYGFFAFSSAESLDPSFYLRLPFPFVISLFYGYFAQVERIRRVARERDAQVIRQQRIAEETRRQRERLEVFYEFHRSVRSATDKAQLLELFLERILIHLPYAAAFVRWRNPETGLLETAAVQGLRAKDLHKPNGPLAFADRIVADPEPLVVRNILLDGRIKSREFFEEEGLVSLIGLPLATNDEVHGAAVFLTREERAFNDEEVVFLSTLTKEAAVAFEYSRLSELSRRQAIALQDAHKVKDEFLRLISTELKTPLNVLLGYTDMFHDGLLGTLTPIQEKAIETLARQSRELQKLIDGVLQVSHLEAETLRADMVEINLWEFLSEIRADCELPQQEDRNIVWDCPTDLPAIQGDRGKLKVILANLIDNAVRATERGTITVSLRYLSARKALEIKVADTGSGIPAAELSAIFERFYQAQGAPAAPHRGGFGLGLYVVKKYAEFLGGTVQVESRAGNGTTFTLRIPASSQRPASGHEQLPLLVESETLLPAADGAPKA
jgi:signal transduction histidine kinase